MSEKSAWNSLVRIVAELRACGWTSEQLKEVIIDGEIYSESPDGINQLDRAREKGFNEAINQIQEIIKQISQGDYISTDEIKQYLKEMIK